MGSPKVARARGDATWPWSPQLLQQLGEQDGLIAGRTGDGDPEPPGEAAAALTASLVEEPLAAADALVEDVETVSAAWRHRDHGLLTPSPEGSLPAGGGAVRAGPTAALVLLAAELADA
jgi:hypothetical protein